MSYIYDNIEFDIDIDELAYEYGINKFHLYKIFKKQRGRAIYETIKIIRLQKAANLLIANNHLTISEISNMCGYSAYTSFSRAFKKRFGQTPKYWRNGGFIEYSNSILNEYEKQYTTNINFNSLKHDLVKVKPRMAYYCRQVGYSSNYNNIWKKMDAWIYTHKIKEYEQIGIYHDNPTITQLHEGNYVACVIPKDPEIELINNNLPVLVIDECLCVTFEIEGTDADILMFTKWVYHEWLPNSEYDKTIIPSYIIFKNDYIENKNGIIKGTFHIPVSPIF
ncbi:MAG: AraC family transcriptional regulator [Campylobacteraceae bacterium]|nr:AraC family transcriptional regulator [Campylobacteraceae bacterium]